jgi:hypothetical protein
VKTPKALWLRRIVAAPVVVYALVVASWVVAHELVGDEYWLLALLNALAVYLFVPLPIATFLALLARRPTAWISIAMVTLLFAGLFTGELTPPLPPSAPATMHLL